MGNDCFMGVEASFWVKKVFWNQIVVVTAPHCMC